MALTKHRTYGDIVTTGASSVVASSTAPLTLASYAAPGGPDDTFLRARFDFSMSVQVGSTGPPPEIWWPVTQILLLAYWSPIGAVTVGQSFGSSEHFLGSRLLSPVLTPSVTLPTSEYVVTYTMRETLVFQTSRKGNGTNTPRVNLGMTVYDPYTALDGTYTPISISWQGHSFLLWGTPP